MAGGAIVRGCIRAVNARDVKILGRGEVHPSRGQVSALLIHEIYMWKVSSQPNVPLEVRTV